MVGKDLPTGPLSHNVSILSTKTMAVAFRPSNAWKRAYTHRPGKRAYTHRPGKRAYSQAW